MDTRLYVLEGSTLGKPKPFGEGWLFTFVGYHGYCGLYGMASYTRQGLNCLVENKSDVVTVLCDFLI